MKNLFLIDGASGSGKSDLVQYVSSFSSQEACLKKYTTRPERDYEKEGEVVLDLAFVSEEEFNALKLDYIYTYSHHKYGFSKCELDCLLTQKENVFVIVRNADVIRKLLRNYSFINVVPAYIYTERHKLFQRLAKHGVTDERRKYRLKRLELAFKDYLKHPEVYKEILINNSNIDDFHRIIDLLIQKHKNAPDVDEKLIFVLMSFNPKNNGLRDYYNAIKRAVVSQDSSLNCKRLDELYGSFEISKTAIETIKSCRLAIVDLTENSPNVYYELGRTQALEKPCIITQHDSSPVLFYPGQFRILRYNNASELENLLKRELEGLFKTTS